MKVRRGWFVWESGMTSRKTVNLVAFGNFSSAVCHVQNAADKPKLDRIPSPSVCSICGELLSDVISPTAPGKLQRPPGQFKNTKPCGKVCLQLWHTFLSCWSVLRRWLKSCCVINLEHIAHTMRSSRSKPFSCSPRLSATWWQVKKTKKVAHSDIHLWSEWSSYAFVALVAIWLWFPWWRTCLLSVLR